MGSPKHPCRTESYTYTWALMYCIQILNNCCMFQSAVTVTQGCRAIFLRQMIYWRICHQTQSIKSKPVLLHKLSSSNRLKNVASYFSPILLKFLGYLSAPVYFCGFTLKQTQPLNRGEGCQVFFSSLFSCFDDCV